MNIEGSLVYLIYEKETCQIYKIAKTTTSMKFKGKFKVGWWLGLLGVLIITAYALLAPELRASSPSITNLDQISDLEDLQIQFASSQNYLTVKLIHDNERTSYMHFGLQQNLEEKTASRGRTLHVSATYTPLGNTLPELALQGTSNTSSLPSNCLIQPQIILKHTWEQARSGDQQVNGYKATWRNYDLQNKEVRISLRLPIFDKSTADIDDDCFVVEKHYKATTPRGWRLFVLTGTLNDSSCRGLVILGRGGDNLDRSPASYICRDDIQGLDADALDKFTVVDQSPGFAPYLIFVEARSDKCGSRILVSKDQLLNKQTIVQAQWQDFHDDCKEGQYDKNKEKKRIFNLHLANDTARPSQGEGVDTPTIPAPADLNNTSNTCEFQLSGLGLGYILCWLLEGVSQALKSVEGLLYNSLTVDSSDYQSAFGDQGQYTLKTAWRFIRDFVTYAIVATAFFMIISTALDVGIFKNYTVKKYLPRLIVGTILIQFSWALGDMFIQAFHWLGDVLGALMFAGFPEAEEQDLADIFGGGLSTTFSATAFVAIMQYMGWMTLLPILFTATSFFIIGFLFLVARKYLIILLLVLSPLGLALWILPGNDKAWNAYFKAFFYLLAIYPLIVVSIAAGKIFSYLILL